jgi:cardiolipin synthase
MFDRMRQAGCDVFEFNPVVLGSGNFSFAGLNRRNHRKMLVVDGCVGMTGGVNLGNPWAPESAGGLGFRDDMIRIEGPAVHAMREIFLGTFRGQVRERALAAELGAAQAAGSARVRVLANDRWRRRRLIERAYLRRIRTARERILIVNSYFIPRRVVRHALAQATRRGVQVRVLVPLESDVPVVSYATRRLYGWMLARGIQIYEWTQGILHSKIAAIDRSWCTVGTHNLDYRSWAYNLEINVVVEDPVVANRLDAQVAQDIAASTPVDAYAWRFRPLGTRVLEELSYRLRRLL